MSFRVCYKNASPGVERSTKHFLTADGTQVYVELYRAERRFLIKKTYLAHGDEKIMLSADGFRDEVELRRGIKLALNHLGIRFDVEHKATEKLRDMYKSQIDRDNKESK